MRENERAIVFVCPLIARPLTDAPHCSLTPRCAAPQDPREFIREGAIEALRACVALIAKRSTRVRGQRYDLIYRQVQACFRGSAEAIHGALLTIGELLRNTEGFMLSRLNDVCDTVLKFKARRRFGGERRALLAQRGRVRWSGERPGVCVRACALLWYSILLLR